MLCPFMSIVTLKFDVSAPNSPRTTSSVSVTVLPAGAAFTASLKVAYFFVFPSLSVTMAPGAV